MSRHHKAETALVAEVKSALEHLPCVRAIWRNQSGIVKVARGWMHLSPLGTPDLVGYLETGIMLAVEVKRPGEEPRPEQDEWIEKARRFKVCAFVATSGTEAFRMVLGFTSGEPLPEVRSVVELAKSRKKKPRAFVPSPEQLNLGSSR